MDSPKSVRFEPQSLVPQSFSKSYYGNCSLDLAPEADFFCQTRPYNMVV